MTVNSIQDSLVYVVDDDQDLAASVTRLLRRSGYQAEPFNDPDALLDAYEHAPAACVITDVMMGATDGFQFAERLRTIDTATAIVFMTAWPSTSSAVDAVRRFGGLDYLEKPVDEPRLLAAVAEGLEWSSKRRRVQELTAALTPRELDVFHLLVRGYSTKAVARELNISPRTVEDHRSQIISKTGARSLPELIDLRSSLMSFES
nr:response regulator [Sphingomonas arenae]